MTNRVLLLIRSIAFIVASCLLAGSPAKAQNIPFHVETYTIAPGVTFDVYLPNESPYGDARPVLLFIHGGGWSAGSRTDLAQLAQYYAGYGLVTVTTDYRLAPANPWPAQFNDVRDVVYTIRHYATYLHASPDRIASIGFSAGGLLAGLLGVVDFKDAAQVSSRVNRVVSIAGPWDLRDPFVNPGNYPDSDSYGMIYNLFGQQVPTEAQLMQASPFYYIDGLSVKTLMLHGDVDMTVPYSQVANTCLKLNSSGSNCQLITMSNTGHALPADLSVIVNPLNAFLQNWLATGQ